MSEKKKPVSAHAAAPSVPTVSGADVVVQSFVNHGVDTVFAYPGGSVIPLHQALTRFREKIRVVLPRHEQGGGFAAQGYARSTGKVGVCTVTSGPGAANLLTAVADAKLDSVPMIVITGQVGTKVIGTDAFQELPTTEVFRSITKHHALVTDPNDLARVMKEAFYIATSGRKGPVLVDIPKDVFMARVTPDYDVEMKLPGYGKRKIPTPTPESVQWWADAIENAKKPVLYVGGGAAAADAAPELMELVQKTGIPVTCTLMGLGTFPADHPLSLDMPGMHGTVYANHAINDCDLLIALGARFDDRITGRVSAFAPHAKIVHVDIDLSEVNKIVGSDLFVAGDVKRALQMLNPIVKAPKESLQPWHDQIQAWKKEFPYSYTKDSEYILPQKAIETLWKMTKDQEPIVSTGVGQHQMWAAQFFRFNTPNHFLSSGGMGTMGFGLPAGMGAKVANPDKMVIVIEGDGSILMNIQEMATCFCEKIPVKVLLLNNQHLGMVVQWEDWFCKSNRGNTYLGPIDNPESLGKGTGIGPAVRYPNFIEIAKGFGWDGLSIAKPEELEAGLEALVAAKGPFLLDVAIPYQEHVMPFIPAGGTFKDVILKRE
ncbi:MAG: biosynthetic-type acetolactate synthase large subunit [Planctomycetia bacterium]|nr:biosynthetic-type acetolactate synthase large subunit [Planctomycetia bacterium]